MTRASAVFIASWIGAFLALPASAQQTPLPARTTPTPLLVAPPQVATPQVQPPASTGQRPQPTHTPTATPTPPGRSLQAFAVTLLLAETQAGASQDDVPPAARKALADLKEFLPYKSYRLVDAQWIRTTSGYSVESRLKGVEQEEYGLRITGQQFSGGVNVRFVLGPSGGSIDTAMSDEITKLTMRRQQLMTRLEQAKKKLQADHPEVVAMERELQAVTAQLETARERQAQQHASLQKSLITGGPIMDATFRMDLDETVVVGTSRIKGDKALIALLTAVGPKAPGAREP